MYDSGLMRVSDLDSEAGAEVLYVEEGELKAILLGRELKVQSGESDDSLQGGYSRGLSAPLKNWNI